jgi:hypothetical protein
LAQSLRDPKAQPHRAIKPFDNTSIHTGIDSQMQANAAIELLASERVN